VPGFHYTGPFVEAGRDRAVDFPWQALDGRPLVYASMGTLQNRRPGVFAAIAAACAPLDAQLVISLGGGAAPGFPAELPGRPLVVPYAPQLEILARAAVAITHAGLNTALEALAHGVPMVALPVTNDQPGVARRVEHVGAGIRIPIRSLGVRRLRQAVSELLTGGHHRERARWCAEAIEAADGLARAAALAERALLA
jgi:MGT family glycosyltransferase